MRVSAGGLVRLEHDWSSVIDIAQQDAGGDDAWAGGVSDALRGLLRTKTDAVVSVVEHDAACAHARYRSFRMPSGVPLPREQNAGIDHLGVEGFRAFYYPARTITSHLEIEANLPPSSMGGAELRRFMGVEDVLGAFAYPEPGVIVSLYAFHDHAVRLTRTERMLLTRLMLHLETGYRLHRRPESVKAVLDLDGNVLERTSDAPPDEVLRAHALQRSLSSAELWPALIAGRLSLVRRGKGRARRYLVIENPPHAQPMHALTPSEIEVVSQAARGHSTKTIAFALGVSSSAVSVRLANAATKLGAATRMELVRLAAMLARDPRARFEAIALTDAEKDVLELLRRGLTNAEIAALRTRSVRTIANQVASLLKKMNATSRRDLATRATD